MGIVIGPGGGGSSSFTAPVDFKVDGWVSAPHTSRSTTLGGANIAYYTPIQIWNAVTIKALGVYVSTGQASSICRVALFNSVDGAPVTKVAEVTADIATTASAAAATAALASNYDAAAGLYFLQVITYSTGTFPTLVSVGGADTYGQSVMAAPSAALSLVSGYHVGFRDTGATWTGGTTPAVGTLTNTSAALLIAAYQVV